MIFNMRVYLFTAIIFSIFPFLLIKPVSAETDSATPSSEISSFILFWPLTAGKTEGDSFYFLKTTKEQVVGWFVFGNMKKADYAVLLGTKRILETEKLLKDGK